MWGTGIAFQNMSFWFKRTHQYTSFFPAYILVFLAVGLEKWVWTKLNNTVHSASCLYSTVWQHPGPWLQKTDRRTHSSVYRVAPQLKTLMGAVLFWHLPLANISGRKSPEINSWVISVTMPTSLWMTPSNCLYQVLIFYISYLNWDAFDIWD